MKRLILALCLVPLAGCHVMVTPPVACDGWVTPCYPTVTAWEYTRANGCVPRPYPTVVYAKPTDPEVVEAENQARVAEAELEKQKKINEAKARAAQAELELKILRGEVVVDEHGNVVPTDAPPKTSTKGRSS
jgi:hypothetical protein